MSIGPLLRDPLFQVNLMLWAAVSRPELRSPDPTLCNCGYLLRALGQKLTPGPELRAHFMRLFNNVGPPAPDLILENISSHPWLIIECKANSFSASSSTAQQAKKLLMLAADIGNVLGLANSETNALVTYVVPFDVAEQQLATLADLQQSIGDAGAPCAAFGVFSIDADATTVGMRLLARNETYATLPAALTSRMSVLNFDEGDDPRPLYLLPYDPSITQEADEANRAKTQLFQRAYSEIVSEIARTRVPERITIDCRDVLRRITFGVSQNWRGPDADLTAVIIAESALNDIKICSDKVDVRIDSRMLLSLTVSNVGLREQLVDGLLKVKPSTGRSLIDERQQELFGQ